MDDLFVGQLMTTPVETAGRHTPTATAAQHMRSNDIGSLLVTDPSGRLEGIVTATDFVTLAANETPVSTIGDLMSTDLTTTTAQTEIRDVADLIVEHGFHHVPVVDTDGHAIGIITTTDFAAYLSHIQTPSP